MKDASLPTAVVAAAAAPLLPSYAWIFFWATLGALVHIAGQDLPEGKLRRTAAVYVFRALAISLAFTGIVAAGAAKFLELDVSLLMWPTAFALAWKANSIGPALDRLLHRGER